MKKDKYKFKYFVDPLNRLVISQPFAPDSVLHQKIVVNGKFVIDKNNNLEYRVKSLTPGARQWLRAAGGEDNLHKVKFKGKWSLTPDHNLKFSLLESRTQMLGNNLILTTDIISAKANELLVAITARGKGNSFRSHILKLAGQWQVSKNNRLKFLVQRYRRPDNALLFKGGWDIGKNYEIIYKYKRTELKTKTRADNEFILAGIWDIFSKKQLKFLVGGDTQSTLNFKAELQTPVIYAKKGEIRYKVGIGLTTQRGVIRRIVFSGKWHLNRDLSLAFKIKYKSGKVGLSYFKADYSIDSKNKISCTLKNEENKKLGIKVIFTRRFFKDSEAFIRYRDSLAEKAIEFGVRVIF